MCADRHVCALLRCAIADALKREGNTLFIEKKYAEAEALYSKALGHDPTNKFILGNRSVTRRHLGNFSGALEDATAAVHAAPDWAKVRICVPACFLEPAWLTAHVCVVCGDTAGSLPASRGVAQPGSAPRCCHCLLACPPP